MTQQPHWRDRAIGASEAISDGFEVLKAYGARLAEWILFFCLIANIIEIFPLSEPFATMFGNIVLGVQVVTLDIAGFGLTTMGDHARRRGDLAAATKASVMGWTLISLMMLTVGLVTVSLMAPSTKPLIDLIEKGLVLARVVVTVLYGHIVHSLRTAGTAYENQVLTLQQEVSRLQEHVQAKQQEVSSVQSRLSSVQGRVSTLEEELDTSRREVSSVQRHLDSKQQEVSSIQQELDTSHEHAASLRQDLHRARLDAEDLRNQLDGKQQEVSSLRRDLSTLQKAVSSSPRVQVSSSSGVQVSSVQGKVDTGQGKVLHLDTNRPRSGGQEDKTLETQIRDLLAADPSLSARAIAARLGCSPTTAAKWKVQIEQSA